MDREIMRRQLCRIWKGKVNTIPFLADIMLLLVVLSQVIDGVIHGILDDTCLGISFFLPHLFANVTMVMERPVMLC